MEARLERIRHHLRRPVPGRRDLLTMTAGNTVREIDPPKAAARLARPDPPVVSNLVSFASVQGRPRTSATPCCPSWRTSAGQGKSWPADLESVGQPPRVRISNPQTDCDPGPRAAQSDACGCPKQPSGPGYAEYVPKGTTGTARCQRLCSSAANQTRPARLFTRRLLYLCADELSHTSPPRLRRRAMVSSSRPVSNLYSASGCAAARGLPITQRRQPQAALRA